MGKTYDALTPELQLFIQAQKIFFVATAPLGREGRVNVSRKGYQSFAILDERTVAFLDLGGSGVETIAHLRENERITVMFCAFEGAANIVRLYGRGEAVTMADAGFAALRADFPGEGRARAVIRICLDRISDSCGWGVPFFDFVGERDQLQRWVDARPYDEWAERRYETNAFSIDGLPGLTRPPPATTGQ
jgi:hypothetical protein